MTKRHMTDEFGEAINTGDSFLRIEQRMGGAILRYYFFGGFADDGRIHVQEYGGTPRVILNPSGGSKLIKLTAAMMTAKGLTPPSIESVTAPAAKKSKKSKTPDNVEL